MNNTDTFAIGSYDPIEFAEKLEKEWIPEMQKRAIKAPEKMIVMGLPLNGLMRGIPQDRLLAACKKIQRLSEEKLGVTEVLFGTLQPFNPKNSKKWPRDENGETEIYRKVWAFNKALRKDFNVFEVYKHADMADFEAMKERGDLHYNAKMESSIAAAIDDLSTEESDEFEGNPMHDEDYDDVGARPRIHSRAYNEKLFPNLKFLDLESEQIRTEKDLDRISETAEGRAKLRALVLRNGEFLLPADHALHDVFKLYHLFRGETIWVNNNKAIFDGERFFVSGKIRKHKRPDYYFPHSREKRVEISYGDTIYLEGPGREKRLDTGLTQWEEKRLSRYSGRFKMEKHSQRHQNNTFRNRLRDHRIMLDELLGKRNRGSDYTKEMSQFRKLMFPTSQHKAIFVDIGPGMANYSAVTKKANPAITLQEIAKDHPEMPCYGLDLPEQVALFVGDKTAEAKADYRIPESARRKLLAKKNFHIISGNGLKPIRAQIENDRTNPYASTRPRPKLDWSKTTVVLRTANAIDVYFDWKTLRPTLKRVAQDFKQSPVMYYFAREILFKPAGSTKWRLVGQVSKRGFRNNSSTSTNLHGAPPYYLDKTVLDELELGIE